MAQNCEDVEIRFGKFKGQTLGDVLAADPSYLDFLAGLDDLREPLKSAVAEMCTKYASEIEKAIGD